MAREDAALLARCQTGDARAWERLIAKYERLVFSIPLAYGLGRDDAADIAQLTFTILMQSLGTLRADPNLAGWLATVARRHSWRLLAARRRREGDADVESAAAQRAAGPDDALERVELLIWLHEGLSRVATRCRDLLVALYFDRTEPSYAEIARRFAMPVGSVGPTRARCLEGLRRAMGVAPPRRRGDFSLPPDAPIKSERNAASEVARVERPQA